MNHPQKLDLLLSEKKKLGSKICAKTREEQFPDDFYAEENILFCKFCLHCVDTIKRSYKIKNSFDKKKSSKTSSQLKQKTIPTLLKC